MTFDREYTTSTTSRLTGTLPHVISSAGDCGERSGRVHQRDPRDARPTAPTCTWSCAMPAAPRSRRIRRRRSSTGIDRCGSTSAGRTGPRARATGVTACWTAFPISPSVAGTPRAFALRILTPRPRAVSAVRRKLILDVRMNGGGNDQLAFDVAGRFAPSPVNTGYVRFRSGPCAQ